MATRRTGERITLSEIREMYLNGEYELCLTMCDRFTQSSVKDAAEIMLLRARCLIQLGRGDEALEVLHGLRVRDEHHDEFVTGRMLMSAAYVSLGKNDEGVKIAQDVYEYPGEIHSSIHAELALILAIAHYRKGEYARAERLLITIPETEDILYVRALQQRGAIARIYGKPVEALSLFREAFDQLHRCRNYDRFTEARLLYSLTYLSAQLPKLDLWPEVSRRIEEFDWSASGVTNLRYWIAIEASFLTELLGDLDASSRWASLAERIAHDPNMLIGAWCRLAACLGRYGEKRGHAHFTNKALAQYDAIPRDSRLREQSALPLDIAEEVLYGDSYLLASRLVSNYSDVASPVRDQSVEGRKRESRYAAVSGLLEERRGNKASAEEAYRRAFDIDRSIGLIRSASILAYRLFVLTGDSEYETFIEDALQGASEKYWVKS